MKKIKCFAIVYGMCMFCVPVKADGIPSEIAAPTTTPLMSYSDLVISEYLKAILVWIIFLLGIIGMTTALYMEKINKSNKR